MTTSLGSASLNSVHMGCWYVSVHSCPGEVKKGKEGESRSPQQRLAWSRNGYAGVLTVDSREQSGEASCGPNAKILKE